MDQNGRLQGEGPPSVRMDASIEETALQEQQEHVEEPDQVTGSGHHGVKPEGVDDRPREKVTVVGAGKADDLPGEGNCPAKELAPPVVFHQQNPDEQDDYRALAAEDWGVLGETVVPDVRLDQMEEDEKGVGSQG